MTIHLIIFNYFTKIQLKKNLIAWSYYEIYISQLDFQMNVG